MHLFWFHFKLAKDEGMTCGNEYIRIKILFSIYTIPLIITYLPNSEPYNKVILSFNSSLSIKYTHEWFRTPDKTLMFVTYTI